MKAVEPYYGYQVVQVSDGWVITYQRSKYAYGVWVPFLILFLPVGIMAGIIFGGLLGDFLGSVPVAFALIAALVSLGGPTAIVALLNRFLRKPRSIYVRNNQIQVGRASYDLSHISNIFVQGPKGQIFQPDGMIVGGTGMVGAAAVAFASVNNLLDNAMRNVRASEDSRSGWGVCITYGVKTKRIVHGVEETRAHAIGNEIYRICWPTSGS